ncbi:MAG TPA: glycosyltransferase [Candidatus Paceibacterota bacterium]
MRIAICTDAYLPQLSGVADSLDLLATTLRQRGHEVRVYAPNFPGVVADPHIVRLPSYAIPGSARSMMLVFPFGIVKKMRVFKPEVIHVNTFSTAGMAGLYAGWRLGIPVVATDHTSPSDYLHYVGLDFAPFRWSWRKFAAWFHGRSAVVTAPTRHILDELARYGMHGVPTEVISNPVALDVFRPLPQKQELKKKYGIGENAVLIFGRIAMEKNLDFAADIFADVAARMPAQLVILGDGPYRGALARRLDEKGVADKTLFLGVLRGAALIEAVNAADVCLVTSLSEIQPMATLQAMACALPIVGARAGGLPECITDGKTGFTVDPKNKNEFVKKIIALLQDKKLAEQCGKAGREAVQGYFPEHIAERFEQVYQKVLIT